MRPRTLPAACLFTHASACSAVIGTSDYEPCEEETCPAGGGGAAPGTGGAGGANPTTGSGQMCVDVTVNVAGSVKVKLQEADFDFEAGQPGPVCLTTGTKTFVAECDQGGGDDPPVAVSWGNSLCEDGTTSCQFDLQTPQVFTVESTDCL